MSTPTPEKSNKKYYTGRPTWVDREYANKIRVPHTFVIHNYSNLTQCQVCRKLLRGIIRQGVQCKGMLIQCLHGDYTVLTWHQNGAYKVSVFYKSIVCLYMLITSLFSSEYFT